MAASAAPRPRSLPSPDTASAGASRPAATTRPGLASTTHTTELTQLAVLNRKLENPPEGDPITAGDLGLPGEIVPNAAVLVALRWEGPPEYPYIHGRFSTGAPDQLVNANLHTPALREISNRLGLRQIWGA